MFYVFIAHLTSSNCILLKYFLLLEEKVNMLGYKCKQSISGHLDNADPLLLFVGVVQIGQILNLSVILIIHYKFVS